MTAKVVRLFSLVIGVITVASGCNSMGDFLLYDLPAINHGLNPAAVKNAEMRGDYKTANQLRAYDALPRPQRTTATSTVQEVVPAVEQEKATIKVFAYNYYNSSIGHYLDDDAYIGKKNKYRKDERICFLLYTSEAKAGDSWSYKLICPPNGTNVIEVTREVPAAGHLWQVFDAEMMPKQTLMNYFIRKNGIGTYKFAAYLNRSPIGSCEIEITE